MRTDRLLPVLHLVAVAYAATGRPLTVPLSVVNRCSDTIWPAIFTQNGTGPDSTGFELRTASTRNLTVAANWNGRVWGRTNCTFNSNGVGSCGTGDCGGNLTCTLTGGAATLAEFNLLAYMNQSYYDISLVDGYNLPLAIQVLQNTAMPMPMPNQTNPSCIGSVQDLASIGFNPYNASSGLADFLGTSRNTPLPFDTAITPAEVSSWCPTDLQQDSSSSSKTRPPFNPCLSACARQNKAEYCCTGKHNSPKKCGPNYYSRAAKRVCPDAYSYAFDDAASTFAVPAGAGFAVVFCPGGRSTAINRASGKSRASSGPGAGLGCVLGALVVQLVFALVCWG